jgi:hypothetical protein
MIYIISKDKLWILNNIIRFKKNLFQFKNNQSIHNLRTTIYKKVFLQIKINKVRKIVSNEKIKIKGIKD